MLDPKIGVCETTLGWIAFTHAGAQLLRLSFGHPSCTAAVRAVQGEGLDISTARFATQLSARLERYADGETVGFADLELDQSHLTPFAKRVAAACRAIPYGEVRTYGQLAAECGRPGAARAVGTVMANNRTPLVVPCHRVVPAGGKLGGFSAPQGVRMKERLLALEGADWSAKLIKRPRVRGSAGLVRSSR